jgi:hypothetical protein
MNGLRIQLAGERLAFNPGEELAGSVNWSGEQGPRSLELRLFWFTRGKGIEDVGLIENLNFEQPLPQETRSFRLKLPQAPYSCLGTLVSVIWALELIAYPSKAVTRQEIMVGPGRKAVKLGTVATERVSGLSVRFGK